MLNTSPRHTSGAHVRSPRGGRERGSSVPIMDAETRRRVDPFPGLGNPNPLWVQGLAHKEANLCMAQCPEVELPPEALMG